MTWDASATATQYGAALLTGERVRLRVLRDDDLDVLAGWWHDPEWAALQHGPIRPADPRGIRERFQAWSRNDDGSGVGFSIEHDGALAGHLTIFGADLPVRRGTYAVMLGAPHVGKGLGTDATRIALRYAFSEMGLNKVELQVWSFNHRAIRSYEKAGFVREGTRRAAGFHDGCFHDQILMGVLASEWAAKQR